MPLTPSKEKATLTFSDGTPSMELRSTKATSGPT
jgi:hypothetical protein